MGYLTSKFRSAVLILSGRGPIKQRLMTAYTAHLSDLHDDEMAPEQRAEFAKLRLRLHQVRPMNGEGPIRASVRKMSPNDAAECAEIVVELYAQMLSADVSGRSLHLVDSGRDGVPPIPKFLTKS